MVDRNAPDRGLAASPITVMCPMKQEFTYQVCSAFPQLPVNYLLPLKSQTPPQQTLSEVPYIPTVASLYWEFSCLCDFLYAHIKI